MIHAFTRISRAPIVALALVLAVAVSADASHPATTGGPTGARAAAPAAIAWQTNLYAAYSQAVAERRPLVVYLYVRNGQYCTQFESGALSSAEVNGLARRAIFASVDAESDDVHHNVSAFIKQLGVERYPTVTVVDAYSDVILERAHVTGLYEPAEFYAWLNTTLAAPAAVPPKR